MKRTAGNVGVMQEEPYKDAGGRGHVSRQPSLPGRDETELRFKE